MEQLGILGPNLLFHAINFLVMLVILRLVAYDPILNLFEQRRTRIREGLAEAERVREEAAAERERLESQLAEERRASQERLREAVAKSEEAAERREQEARARAQEIVEEAREDAERMRREALAGLQNEIADMALLAASKVVGQGLDADEHRRLVDRVIQDELGELA